MSAPLTPLEKLADAVHEFFSAVGMADGAFVTGWAVIASTARIQADDATALPLVGGARYALGPETSVVQAAGLARFLDVVCERATYQQLAKAEADRDGD
jgi:hypothetical protein